MIKMSPKVLIDIPEVAYFDEGHAIEKVLQKLEQDLALIYGGISISRITLEKITIIKSIE